MIKKECKVCGKEFNAKQSNYTLCSDKCRLENKISYSLKYNRENKNKIRIKKKIYYNDVLSLRNKYVHVEKFCLSCGKRLKHGNQSYCFNCLIIGSASPDVKYRNMCKNTLRNRGYDISNITAERQKIIKNNGYIYIHNFDNSTIGERFSQIVRESGLTNKEVSKMLFVSSNYISQYKRDLMKIPDDVIEAISKKFNVSTEWLINGC